MKPSISQMQRDLDEMNDRINRLSSERPRDNLAKAVARLVAASRGRVTASGKRSDASVRLIEPPTKVSDVGSAIAYARHLSSKNRGSVFLDSEGRRLYEKTLAQVRREARSTGVIVLNERVEVIKRLEKMPGGGVVQLQPSLRIRAPLQKFMDGAIRVVRAFASTSEIDRAGDVLVPSGMKAKLPVSLLWQHDTMQPIGSVRLAEVRGAGIWIEAPLVAGVARADEAWALIEGGAVDSFSVGFRALKTPEPIASGFRYTSWELLEVSLVSVPANPGAKLRRYK
jgi:HK97 family phage prohead protease